MSPVTHEPDFACCDANRALFLAEPRVDLSELPDAVLKQPRAQRTLSVLPSLNGFVV